MPRDERRAQNSEQPGVCDAPAAASGPGLGPVGRVDGVQTSERKTKGFVSIPVGQGAKRKGSRGAHLARPKSHPSHPAASTALGGPAVVPASRRLKRSAAALRKGIRNHVEGFLAVGKQVGCVTHGVVYRELKRPFQII